LVGKGKCDEKPRLIFPLVKGLNVERETTFGDYKKFRVETSIKVSSDSTEK